MGKQDSGGLENQQSRGRTGHKQAQTMPTVIGIFQFPVDFNWRRGQKRAQASLVMQPKKAGEPGDRPHSQRSHIH